ncbi:glycosyltransferase [Paracoccus sp. YIM 132242]|uniref:Glycosyltransferase n=1 Tax=Paracoccus lichenicola TaxID=2665644 RepID=A0A6L6HU12_9RHOB|nr:glycosyltransferase family A protein [Paracoccus lichenicola]MTE01752.1 glycosyltransferase [Paracoccus lichenicola]
MFFVLELDCSNGSKLALVADRPEDFASQLVGCGDFDSLRLIEGLGPHYTIDDALRAALNGSDAALVAVLANPAIVIDPEMPLRLGRALLEAPDPATVGVITGKGTDRWGNRFSAFYASAEPQLPFCRTPVPVTDSASDLFILARPLLERLLARGALPPVESLAGWAVLEGYLEGCVSYHSPHLAAGIYGRHLPRQAEAHADILQDLIGKRVVRTSVAALDGTVTLGGVPERGQDTRDWHLNPRADLDRQMTSAILPHCRRMSLSIVTRTQFSRPHLLRRLLASLSRWRSDDLDLEVVLSTDIDRARAEAELAALRIDFPALTLVLAWNGARAERSRVRNLLGGIKAATQDYVAFVDDDDHVHFQALTILSTTRFLGTMPVVFMDTELRKEGWVQAGDGRWVLDSATAHHRYPAGGWRNMFGGVNQLPICAGILPRDWVVSQVGRFDFRHDYSEDFTLFLLLLQSADLPLILDVPRPFCIVSIRSDGSNTVTEEDRSGWVKDISMFLHDLHIVNSLHGEGRLQTVIECRTPRLADAPPVPLPASNPLRRELAVARAENEALRARLADLELQAYARERAEAPAAG